MPIPLRVSSCVSSCREQLHSKWQCAATVGSFAQQFWLCSAFRVLWGHSDGCLGQSDRRSETIPNSQKDKDARPNAEHYEKIYHKLFIQYQQTLVPVILVRRDQSPLHDRRIRITQMFESLAYAAGLRPQGVTQCRLPGAGTGAPADRPLRPAPPEALPLGPCPIPTRVRPLAPFQWLP